MTITPDEVDRINKVLQIMNDPNSQPVYIHCAHGADRTGLVVALYRVIDQQMPASEAYREMYDDGHGFWHMAFTSPMDFEFFKVVRETVIKKKLKAK